MNPNKQIPKLRFPEFTLPWDFSKLGDIAQFSKGKGITKADIDENGVYECIRYGELYTLYGETINEVKSKTNIDKNDLIFSEANDVIIPASGETQIDIATASCVLKAGIALGGDLNIIKTKNNGVFLSYYLNSMKKHEIATLAQGVSVVHLYSSQLALLELCLPSIKEQQKIAKFISVLDEKIKVLTSKKYLLEKYRTAIIQNIISENIKFKNESGNMYPNWKIFKLRMVLKESNEKSSTSNKYRLLSSTSKGLFNQDEYFTRNIASKDNSGYKILRKNQLVFSPQNLWMGNINVNMNFLIGIVSPSYRIYSFDEKYTSANFCQYFLLTPEKMFQFEQASVQGASIVRRNLDLEKFLNIEISLPSIEEQSKIASFLNQISNKIENTNKLILKTTMFKKGLLQNMFC